jgi:CHAT domain-containing protein/tetratricopeptide (TPR) repeat protein
MLDERTRRTVGAIVAVVVCAVLASRMYDAYPRMRLRQSVAHLADLVAAEYPLGRSRMSTALPPRTRPARGARRLASVYVDGAIATVVTRAVALRTIDGRRAAAIAHHYHRRYAVAAAELEQIVGLTNAAADWNDLAATRLEMAGAARSAEGLLDALIAVNHALEIDQRFTPALYNRAAILESLGLYEHARDAWARCLAAEGDSGWRAIVASHLTVLPALPDDAEWADVSAKLAAASPSEVQQMASRFPQQARIHATTVLPTEWAAAILQDDPVAATTLLASAKRLAKAVDAITGDHFAVDATRLIDEAVKTKDAIRTRRLALAYSTYREGRILFKNHDAARAETRFRDAAASFSDIGSPMHLVARHYAALTVIAQNRGAAAVQELRAIVRDLEPSYLALTADIGWPLAYQEGVSGRWDAALAAASASANGFRALGEKESTGSMENLLAEVYDFLGQPARAWQHRVIAFSLLSQAGDPYRLQVALAGASRPHIREKTWPVAIALLDLEIERSNFPENANLRADAMARRARVRYAQGDVRGAQDDLLHGRTAAMAVPDGETRTKLLADLDEAAGIVARSESLDRSVCYLTNAIAFYESTQRSILLPELFLERAISRLAAGHLDLAQADLDAGISQLETQRSTVSEFESAGTITDPAADLYIEAVRLAVARRDSVRAFDYAERSRGRALAKLLPKSPAATMTRWSADVIAVEYMVLPEQLVIFIAGRDVEMHTVAIPAEKLETLVDRLSSAMTSQASSISDAIDASSALYQLLIRPIEAAIEPRASVVFVANGILGRVPWAGLYDDRSHRYLIEKLRVRSEPSVEIFSSRPQRVSMTAPMTALVVGNPRSSSPLFDELPSLGFAEAEARAVAALYQHAVPLFGQNATKRRVLEQASRSEVLHFSGHAVSSADEDSESFLILASEGTDDSGLLYSREIARLDLRRSTLVVLAACGTLRGSTVHLDGTPSIAQAFLAAGAPAVIATLWDIDDARSARLFSEIHHRVIGGESAGEALREVQLRAIRSPGPEMAHPRTWSGITLVGGFDP